MPPPNRRRGNYRRMTDQSRRKPAIIGWEITNQCNLSCPHCYTAAAKRPHDEMTTAECKRVIDAMAAIGVGTIGWTGGEPLLREDLEELTAYAGSRGIDANITTNGVLLNLDRAVRLMEAGISVIQISLDGSTPQRNRQIRGASDEQFHRIIDAIRIWKSLNLRVHMATLIARENLDDTRDMVQLGLREGVDLIRFCGFAPVGRGKGEAVRKRLLFSEGQDDLLAFVNEVQEESPMIVTFDVSFGPVPPEFGFHTCIAGIGTFYLKGNGDIYPCTALMNRRFLAGNVRETPLEEIWRGPKMSEMANYPRHQIKGACQTCDNFFNCHGACRGATFAHTGDLDASFPLCLYRTAVEKTHRT
jgi:radical SAM protein with 4Fe4S-binding SPASM domain